MQSATVLFAIDAAVKLGRKLYDILIDDTAEQPLLLPVGELFGSISEAEAQEFFDSPQGQELLEPGAPYHGFTKKKLVKAFKTVKRVELELAGVGIERDPSAAAVRIVADLHAFELYKAEFKSRPPVQRVLGTVVEIGIDYVVANPLASKDDAASRQLLQAFLEALDDADFSEGNKHEIVDTLMLATLETLHTEVALISDEARTRSLLTGVTSALIMDYEKLISPAKRESRRELVRRIGTSILRGGATAFTEDIALFTRDGERSTVLVRSTLEQLLVGIEGKEKIFTNESLELVFRSALAATGENAELFSEKKILQELIKSTVSALKSQSGRQLFAPETVGAVLQAALEVAGENVETLFDPDDPQEQLLATALEALAKSFSSTLAGGGGIEDLLSRNQRVELAKIIFQEVARHPEQLLDVNESDARKMAVAQIVGSVARALGDDPGLLINGEGFVELVRIAVGVAFQNADKLLDLESLSPRENMLFAVLHQTVTGMENGDPRGLIGRDVFLELVDRILPVASANLELLLDDAAKLVEETVRTALDLAHGELENRINGLNLPILIEGLLLEVLWDELNLDEATAVLLSATEILRAA